MSKPVADLASDSNAAIAYIGGLPLLTDDAHLRRVAGLDCIDWTTPPNGA